MIRLPSRPRPFLLIAVLLPLAGWLMACEDAGQRDSLVLPGGATPVDDPFSGGYPTYDDAATGFRIVFGTPDLGVGPSRVSVAVFDEVGIVSLPVLHAATRFYADGPDGDFHGGPEVTLRFQPFPESSRGIYAGFLEFDEPGLWAFDVAIPRPSGETVHVLFPVEVSETTVAPQVGEAAPASKNRTVEDSSDLRQLTTSSEPDAALYQHTIADTLERGLPFVVTFASPAFCTNALCGPQVEVLSELEDRYGEQAGFIHVDLYENPEEIRRDFSARRRTPILDEWGVHTDEWTFVVDGTGTITARFEGFAPLAEVEPALREALGLSVAEHGRPARSAR